MNNDQKFDLIMQKLEAMDNKIETMDSKIETMDNKIATMENEIGTMGAQIDSLQSDVTSIKIQIENEIVPNIKRVAEGHLDLDRHLKDVVTSRTEYEILTLRVNHLESVVEKIEKKIS